MTDKPEVEAIEKAIGGRMLSIEQIAAERLMLINQNQALQSRVKELEKLHKEACEAWEAVGDELLVERKKSDFIQSQLSEMRGALEHIYNYLRPSIVCDVNVKPCDLCIKCAFEEVQKAISPRVGDEKIK